MGATIGQYPIPKIGHRMSFDLLLTLLGLAIASTWTPGPNNAMVASSGATFGLRATAPHALGITLGFPLMIFCIALGLGGLFQQSRLLQEALRLLGVLGLLWVAWRIANAKAPGSDGAATRPFTFLQAVAFQWINPKAWVMAVGTTAQFMSGNDTVTTALIIAMIFMASGLTSSFGWTFFGVALQKWLNTHQRLRIFNLTMALLILACIIALVVMDFS